jgi:hypothetical protein
LPTLPDWLFWLMPLSAGAIVLNIANRIRGGIASARSTSTMKKNDLDHGPLC